MLLRSLIQSSALTLLLKIEVLDTYKAKPPTADTQKNDVAFVFSITYKL
jgi:hypothetical protein